MAWTCIRGFNTAGAPTHLVAKLCLNALFNDYVSKCAKVFESGRQAASIWYIERTNAAAFHEALGEDAHVLDEMRDVAARLKHLRDRELMHIDESGVLNREQTWETAAIDPKKLHQAVGVATATLRRIADQNGILVAQMPRELTVPRARDVALHFYSWLR